MKPLLLLAFFWLGSSVAGAQTEPDRRFDRLQRLLRSPRETMRVEALQQLDSLTTAQRLTLLIPASEDPSPAVRRAAVRALERCRHQRVAVVLAARLRDADEHVRADAVAALARLDGPRYLAEISALVRHDPAAAVRVRAVAGLGTIRAPSALPVMIAALSDPQAAVREQAAIAVEALADASLPARLRETATSEHAPTRRLVMRLLGRYGSEEEAINMLMAGLRDPDPLVRGQAAIGLGYRQAKSALPALMQATADADDHVRGTAAYALGRLRDSTARPALRRLLNDESAAVRAVAAESLQKLGDSSVAPPRGFQAADLYGEPPRRDRR